MGYPGIETEAGANVRFVLHAAAAVIAGPAGSLLSRTERYPLGTGEDAQRLRKGSFSFGQMP